MFDCKLWKARLCSLIGGTIVILKITCKWGYHNWNRVTIFETKNTNIIVSILTLWYDKPDLNRIITQINNN